MLHVVVLGLLALASGHSDDEAMVKLINEKQSTWKAGPSPISKQQVVAMLGALDWNVFADAPRMTVEDDGSELPDTLDFRDKYPHCPSIASVKDQSSCGSCWAVAVAAAASDRLCISNDIKTNLSAGYMMSCCSTCGYGCRGGYPNKAWEWIQTKGIVTGGDFGSHEGCQPYPIEPCSNDPSEHKKKCPTEVSPTPMCRQKCTNRRYKLKLKKDRRKFIESSVILPNNVELIQKEMLKNGPVVAAFYVYEDFIHYKSGVYQHLEGKALGGHAVRVIGFGTEGGTPYWLVQNSWTHKWGDNGLFKIIRGINDCRFESFMTAGEIRKKGVFGEEGAFGEEDPDLLQVGDGLEEEDQ